MTLGHSRMPAGIAHIIIMVKVVDRIEYVKFRPIVCVYVVPM